MCIAVTVVNPVEKMKTALWWIRDDFRLHDQPFLNEIAGNYDFLVPFCLAQDERETGFGFSSPGEFRKAFRAESLLELDGSVRKLGGQVIHLPVSDIKTALEILLPWCPGTVLYYREIFTTYEKLEAESLNKFSIPRYACQDNLLINRVDMPFELAKMPLHFTPFRTQIEKKLLIPLPAPAPNRLPTLPPHFPSELLSPPPHSSGKSAHFAGGEKAGLARLHYYLSETHAIRTYKETRNGLHNPNDSSRLSPWISLGCLSVRTIWAEITQYESRYDANESTYWLKFELLWREFFKWTEIKFGDRIFHPSGLGNNKVLLEFQPEVFEKWKTGNTGDELTDAVMRELNTTGYTTNRGRQNAASYLIHQLKQDWRSGAAWFERQLVDYDPASNYGNWAYIAGVGTDPRGGRAFNTEKQAEQYDPDGSFRNYWLRKK